jgi:hypothetical protein
VAGRFSDVIRNMREVVPAPGWLVSGLYYVLPNFHNFDFKNQVAYGDPVPPAALAWVTLYAVFYVGLLLGGGLLAFSRRDLN